MIELKIPRENANDDSVLITHVHTKNGDFVKEGDIIVEFETSKVTVEFEAPEDGFISELSLQEGEQVPVDEPFCKLSSDAIDTPEYEESETTGDTSADIDSGIEIPSDICISDEAQRLIDAGNKPISAPRWLTSKKFSRKSNEASSPQPVQLGAQPPAMAVGTDLAYNAIALTGRKTAEIKSLRTNSPYLNSTLGIHIDADERISPNLVFEHSIMDLLVYEIFNLLSGDFSDLNRFYIDERTNGQFSDVVPGVAFDNLNNLTVVKIPHFETLLTLSEILVDLMSRYEENQLELSDMRSTSFTVSDLSAGNVNFMLPLINGNQAFIMGICKSESGFQLYGTFDHRVTEGLRFSRFLEELKRRLELYYVESTARSGQQGQKECFCCRKSLAEELQSGYRGLIKIDDGSGEKLMCRNCFVGW